jgi:hypothetical protein
MNGAGKYGPYNWRDRAVRASIYVDACERHLNAWLDGAEDVTDSGVHLTISQWSDQYRVLSRVSAGEPGRWRTSRTPFLREIMDCLSPSSPYSRVVYMKPAQIGGSEGKGFFRK